MYNFLLSLAFSLLGAGKGVAYFLPLRLLFFFEAAMAPVFFFSAGSGSNDQKTPGPTGSGSPALLYRLISQPKKT